MSIETTTTNTAGPDADLLKEIRDNVDQAIKAESENRTLAVDDLKFLTGGENQWPAAVVEQRRREGRPCLTFNRLPTYLHQVTNDQRQNKPGIKVHPVGSGSDVDKAKVVQGIIRHIEYSSNADIAYDTSVNSAAAIGFGYWRLITDYESPTSFDQVIKFDRLRDALKVYIDPNSKEADGSDMKWAAIVSDVARSEFKRAHPDADNATASCVGVIGQQVQPGWMNDQHVRLVEYYYFDYKKATLYLLGDGSTTTEEPPAGAIVKNKRETMIPQLKWVKATAGAVIERTDIMCRWIPVFPVWGNEVDIQGKVHRSGIIRDAKDPAQMYNFWMTNATEEVSLRPKTPFIGAAGQFEGYEDKWSQANSKTFAFLEYNPVSLDGVLAPPPQRAPMADVPTGMLAMAMHASDNIKAVTGLFDSSIGARGNATSGVQERAQQRQGDTANFHYTDNLNRSIRHCGRCIVDMIPHYYDAARVVAIMGDDDEIDSAEINTPQVDPDTQAVTEVLNDLTVGTYDVTVSTGPSYSTLREEAAESMVQVAGSYPALMEVAGDLVVESMDWPGADKIAARLKRSIPPELTKEEGEEGEPPALPPEIEQHIQQADQLIEQLQAELQESKSGLEKARIDAASRERVAEINATARNDVAELTGAIQMMLQHMQPPPMLAAAAASTGGEPATPPAAPAQPAQPAPAPAAPAAPAMPAPDTEIRPDASQAPEPAPIGPTDAMSGS